MQPNMTESAWLAGLFEGEGTFIWRPHGEYYGVPMVRIKMADKDIIERVKTLIGGHLLTEEPRQKGWKRQYYLAYQGSDAVKIMCLILPFMGDRRSAKIRSLIARWQERPGIRKGEESQLSKLSAVEVIEIRKQYTQGSTQAKLAKIFGVSRGNIGHIVRRDSWKHLEGGTPEEDDPIEAYERGW